MDKVVRVAIPSPLRRTFDYLPLDRLPLPAPGCRVRVPFGRREAIGVVAGIGTPELERARLKPLLAILDSEPLLPPDILELLGWAADYYHHPLGEVMAAALPVPLRQGGPAIAPRERRYRLAAAADPDALARAPRQAALLALLAGEPQGLTAEALAQAQTGWRTPMKRLLERGWVEEAEEALMQPSPGGEQGPPLGPAQAEAVAAITAALDRFTPFLLDGVTGGGKTEVYLRAIAPVLAAGRQALVLVPEIGLTPQLVDRFRRRFPVPIALLHSGLGDGERAGAWLAARTGEVPLVIGTRSALFTPLPRLGLIVVDEEHDASFKQQEGFRYSARDLAVMRAHRAGVPVVLGTATPSLESLHNVEAGRYRHLRLPARAGGAQSPPIRLVDLKREPLEEGIAPALRQAAERHLAAGGQVLFFLNRRGYAPVLLCHECGWVGRCDRCDAHYTYHAGERRLRCHHCGAERAVARHCPGCGSADLRAVGQGTERIEEGLARLFPGVPAVRIDRDATRRKGEMERLLGQVHDGSARLLVGTQMLAKGHHFPGVTLVGILDADRGLFSADFRAGERMAQLVVQVAGRAGRAERPGEVLIQTHHPDHPLLRLLVEAGYPEFARAALAERRAARMPPFSHMALVRAEATRPESPRQFLSEASNVVLLPAGLQVWGPVPAPMERRGGRFRAQLLIQADQRALLHRFIDEWLPNVEALRSGRQVRWSLDVDPVELF